ncbi:Peptidoglycan/xylan/chitin deacetylase, PgdA/CDA1 family, partial [Trichococcus flocculiformis]
MKQRFLLLAPLLLMVTLFGNTPVVKASTEEPTQAAQFLIPEAALEETVTTDEPLLIVPTETQTPLTTEDATTETTPFVAEPPVVETSPETVLPTETAPAATTEPIPTTTENPITETPTTVETVPTAPTVPDAETLAPGMTTPAEAATDPQTNTTDPIPETSPTQPSTPTDEDNTETPTLTTDPIEDQTTLTVETDTEIPAEPPIEAEEPIAEAEPQEDAVEEAAAAIMAMASEAAFSTGPSQYVSYVNTSDNVIALTFDDGHSYANLSEILAILDVYGAKATFFMNGDASADLLKQIVDSGHELGNHTYSHQDSTIISADALAYDINLMEDYVQESTGTTSRPLFRAPYGALNDSVLETVGSLGYEYTIGWSIDTLDWSGLSATTISSTITNNINPGDIVLMHASVGAVNTPDSLWYTLSALQNAGYRFSTIGQLLGIAIDDTVDEESNIDEEFATDISRWVDDIDTDQPYVALTFDDLEDAAVVQELLEVLASLNVKATFFPDGKADPYLLALIVEQGHDIGNHTYSHSYSSQLSASQLASELNTMENIIQDATGVTSRPYFRPPYGDYNQSVLETAGSLGYEYTIGWTTDTYDWDGYSSTAISDRVVDNLFPGSIYLLHDAAATPESLWYMVASVRAKGFDFVTMTDLLALDGVFSPVEDDGSGTEDPGGVSELTGLDPIPGTTNPIITKDIVTDRTGQLGVAEPYIVYEDGVYHMFFDVILGYNPDTGSTADEIGHAYSTDMINWT